MFKVVLALALVAATYATCTADLEDVASAMVQCTKDAAGSSIKACTCYNIAYLGYKSQSGCTDSEKDRAAVAATTMAHTIEATPNCNLGTSSATVTAFSMTAMAAAVAAAIFLL